MTRGTALLLIGLLVWPVAAHSEGPIHPTGEGVIRVCRDWDMTGRSCRKYHHINLPSSISVGDAFRVEYGSNPKGYQFEVRRIDVQSGICSIYSEEAGPLRDRIRVTCQNVER